MGNFLWTKLIGSLVFWHSIAIYNVIACNWSSELWTVKFHSKRKSNFVQCHKVNCLWLTPICAQTAAATLETTRLSNLFSNDETYLNKVGINIVGCELWLTKIYMKGSEPWQQTGLTPWHSEAVSILKLCAYLIKVVEVGCGSLTVFH